MTFLRPTNYGLWASGASGNVAEPIAADKAQGFLPTGIARGSYANWLWGIHGQWNAHHDERLSGLEGATRGVRGLFCGFTAAYQGASVAPGAMFVSATGLGATGPTSVQFARGTLSVDMIPLMLANVDAGASLISSVGCRGASLIGTGNYNLRLPKTVTPGRTVVTVTPTLNVGIVGATVDSVVSPGNAIFVNTRTATGVLQNNSFSIAVWEI
jgi:hypothetical protein